MSKKGEQGNKVEQISNTESIVEAPIETVVPKWYIGKGMYCKDCKSWCKVRKDVYIKRLEKALALGIDEKTMNRTYKCRKCRNGSTVKEDAYQEMLDSEE